MTAQGAADYLDHQEFDRSRIEVRYMKYELKVHPQQFVQVTRMRVAQMPLRTWVEILGI